MAIASPFDPAAGDLRGRVAVITGASRGLGAGMAARFAEAGLLLGLCARSVPDAPAGHAGSTWCRSVDVADAGQVERFAAEVVERFGPIDCWVNNAGVLEPIGPQRDHDPADVARALAVNIGGVANGTRTFTRSARTWPARRRLLANISSGASRSVYEGWSIYGATKAAVDHLTEIVAAEEPGVVCRSVAPGVVDTEMQALIRTQDPEHFPAVDRFHEISRAGAWNSPAWVADHLLAMLAGTSTDPDVVVRVPAEPR